MAIADFTYNAYSEMLELIAKCGYTFARYHDYAEYCLPCILRHDIDMDIQADVRIAKLERDFSKELKSSFFVLLSSDFYNVFSKKTLVALSCILELGHEIGLHFDETKYDCMTLEALADAILNEAHILNRALGIEINAVSMHRPSKRILEADMQINGLENCYSKEFMQGFKYVSDSRMSWRENAEEIIASKKYSKLHILTHGFWYSQKSRAGAEIVKSYVNNAKTERYYQMRENVRDIDEFLKMDDVT